MSKYHKDVSKYNKIDVYDLIQIYEVTNPALQHALKKILMAGQRGHKDFQQDCQDIIDSVQRAKTLIPKEGLPPNLVGASVDVAVKNKTYRIASVVAVMNPNSVRMSYCGWDTENKLHYFNKEHITHVYSR